MLNSDVWTKYTVVIKKLSGTCLTIKWDGIPVFHSRYLVIRIFQQVLFITFHYSLGQCATSFSSLRAISITSWLISGLYNNYVAGNSRATDQVYFDSRSSAVGNKDELNWQKREKHIQNKVTFLCIFSSSFLEKQK